MNLQWLNSPTRWKDSVTVGFAILTIIETTLAVSTISLDCLWGKYNWIVKLLLVVGMFTFIVVVAFIVKYVKTKKGISIKIRGIKVNIRQGDIFKEEGWKVIAFNEFFDTTVDDIIIAHNTLNGIFIDHYVEDIDDLQRTITNVVENTKFKRRLRNGRYVTHLGELLHIKTLCF